MKKNLKLLFVIILFSSCHKERILDEYIAIEGNAWDNQNKLLFEVAIQDTSVDYDIYVNVRNAGWYPFSNLFLFLQTTMPTGKMGQDTLECILADKEGNWLGDGLGDIWDNSFIFKKNYSFPQAGKYQFRLEQAMRVNPLPGIADAGLRIEKSPFKK